MFKRLFGRGDEAAGFEPAAGGPGATLNTSSTATPAGDPAQRSGAFEPLTIRHDAQGVQGTASLYMGHHAQGSQDAQEPPVQPRGTGGAGDAAAGSTGPHSGEPLERPTDGAQEIAQPEDPQTMAGQDAPVQPPVHELMDTASSVETPAPGSTGDPVAETDAPPVLEQGQPAVEAPTGPAPWEPLALGTLVADRYMVLGPLTAEEAARLLGDTDAIEIEEAELYAVDDQRGYERCWSCGSTNNEAQQRFCVDCGAPLQHRQVVLARTPQAVGEVEEFAEGGAWYHLVHPRKQFGSTGITLEAGGFSAEGPHHPNEDSYWSAIAGGCYDSASEMFGVFVLADGMGGYAPGSGLISKDIVRTVGRGIFTILHDEPDTEVQEADLQAIVHGAIAQANGMVLDEIAKHGEMGATLVTAVVYGQTAYVANIGDSRAYYISPAGAVTQITRDQSLVEQQIAAGILDPDAVYTAIGNNVILHAIGEDGVEGASDWYSHPLEPGGRLLLCSDGYWKTMAHEVWNPDLALQQPTLRGLAQTLVEQALAHDSDDNTTVVVVGID